MGTNLMLVLLLGAVTYAGGAAPLLLVFVPEVLRDHPRLSEAQRLTIGESLRCVGLQLWDDRSRRVVSFADARSL